MPGVTTAYQTGVHGSRPAANSGCILYSCTTHGLVYRSDGTTWTTFLTLPSGSTAATPALTFGTAAAAGSSGTFINSDATLPIFDATVPSTQAFSDAAAAGAAGVAARRDHKHGMPASPGGGGALAQIAETVLGSAAANITLTGISGAYRDLVVVIRARTTDAGAGAGCWLRVGNGSIDSGSNYSYFQQFTGWTTSNNNSSSDTKGILGSIPNSGATAGFFGYMRIELLNYADAAKSRAWIGQSFSQDGSGILYCDFAGMWKNVAAAIDQLQIIPSAGNLAIGSAVTLYGRG